MIEVPDLKIFEGLSGRLIKTKKALAKLKRVVKNLNLDRESDPGVGLDL